VPAGSRWTDGVSGWEDRVAGALLGAACGDALGAGYEFGPPLPDGAPVAMVGGNGFAPGEWTDDTAMTVAVAQAAAAGFDLSEPDGLDAVVGGFLRWFRDGPTDVGVQTGSILASLHRASGTDASEAARRYFAAHPDRAAGNGALMRTAPVALANLHSARRCATASRAVSDLTHADPVSGEACLLWSLAVRHAVRHATFDGLHGALEFLPPERSDYWADRLTEAEERPPVEFPDNGWVVHALQAAWSSIVHTSTRSPDHLRFALEKAVRAGRDADTVAAIAGALVGARWGASAVPWEWRSAVHGWPGYRADDIVTLALAVAADSESAHVDV
jgi:ADP-ribosyl-[dinitrogen reductase] hydrolase